jgi:hypothetical protein
MDLESATFWLDTIALAAFAVWAGGAWFVIRTGRQLTNATPGDITVAAPVATVRARLTQTIIQGDARSPLRDAIVEASTDQEVRWHSQGILRTQGVAALSGAGRQTQVKISLTAHSPLMLAAKIVVTIGLLAVLGIYQLIAIYVLGSGSPGLYIQVIQMVQAVHFLWPPFMLAGMVSVMRRRVMQELQRSLQNAVFAESTTMKASQ